MRSNFGRQLQRHNCTSSNPTRATDCTCRLNTGSNPATPPKWSSQNSAFGLDCPRSQRYGIHRLAHNFLRWHLRQELQRFRCSRQDSASRLETVLCLARSLVSDLGHHRYSEIPNAERFWNSFASHLSNCSNLGIHRFWCDRFDHRHYRSRNRFKLQQ